jgi:cephalosporin-C deacetylase-like acetyl esterase
MKSFGGLTIGGWYVVPTGKGPFPTLLEVPWYTGGLGPATWQHEFAVFTLHIRGHGKSRDVINPGFPGYLQHRIEDKNNYIYRGAYMDCIRAVDFLYSRPETDTSRLGVFGISQGGGLTLATASLDNRIKAASSAVPFLSCYPVYFKTVFWPHNEFFNYLHKNPGLSWDDIYHTLSYFDVSNLSHRIRCPLFMHTGLQDQTCPPVINFAAYNAIRATKQYHVYSTKGHNAGNRITMLKELKNCFNP